MLAERYAGWDKPEAQAMLTSDLATIAERVDREGLEPRPRSGRQERLENWVNRFV
jgi:xylose isomerase